MKHQRSPLASVTIHTALILGAVVMVFPLLWMLVTSIKTITEATIIPPTLWPDVPQWQNWMDVLIGDGVLQTFFHTLLIALLALALQLDVYKRQGKGRGHPQGAENPCNFCCTVAVGLWSAH